MKKLIRALFGKKVLGVLLLLLQLWIFYIGFYAVTEYSVYIFGGANIIGAVVILLIINREIDSGIKISWAFMIAAMPVFGIALYCYVRLDIPAGKIKNKLRTIYDATSVFNQTDYYELNKLIAENNCDTGTFKYIKNCSGYQLYTGTSVRYFSLGDDAFPVIIDELKKATKYIFLEYFIINDKSEMWNMIHDVLLQKVREGVEVRVMYDGMGSLTTTSSSFCSNLNRQGIKCEIFSSIKPFLSTYQNNRDHRKIIVIDGKTAFSGGINLADEYINKRKMYGHWKDNTIILKGEAVKSFVLMFLRMWNTSYAQPENFEKYIDECFFSRAEANDGYVMPFDDAPFREERIGKNVYTNIINTAKDYVYIMTPYLVLDEDMRSSLKFAAKRGVDVKIIMPHIPDKWYTFALSRTYYPDLIAAGVEIYEYSHGFVHSKTTISDDKKAVVGTINYDYRSMYLNYECGVYMYDASSLDDIKADFIDTISKSMQFKVEDYYSTSLLMRLVGRVLRVFAPLM